MGIDRKRRSRPNPSVGGDLDLVLYQQIDREGIDPEGHDATKVNVRVPRLPFNYTHLLLLQLLNPPTIRHTLLEAHKMGLEDDEIF